MAKFPLEDKEFVMGALEVFLKDFLPILLSREHAGGHQAFMDMNDRDLCAVAFMKTARWRSRMDNIDKPDYQDDILDLGNYMILQRMKDRGILR